MSMRFRGLASWGPTLAIFALIVSAVSAGAAGVYNMAAFWRPAILTSATSITLTASITLSANDYAYVSSPATLTAGVTGNASNPLTVDACGSISGGNSVVVLQTQDYSTTNNAGKFEYATVDSCTGTTLILKNALQNTYYTGARNTANAQSVQVVQVNPTELGLGKTSYPGNLIIATGGSIKPYPWDGSKGGIIALTIGNALTVSGGSINVNAMGFRGSSTAGYPGESYKGLAGSASNAPRGGGGGGNTWNASGQKSAGGSYGTMGSWGTYLAAPGYGYGDPGLTKIFLGSAGGTSYTSSLVGGTGGGIILIDAKTLSVTSGGITANGGNGTTDAGAGSGGTIKITASNSLAAGSSLVTAIGGTSSVAGGLGRIYLSGSSVTGNSNPESYKPSGSLNLVNNTVVNHYAAITSATFGSGTANTKSFTVDDPSSLGTGDTVLIIQSQDYNYGTAGEYEKAVIGSIAGKTISLTADLTNTYYSGTTNTANALAAQLVRVPQYTGVTLTTGGIRAMPWDGTKGGIIAFDVTGAGALTLSGSGSISVDSVGYRASTSSSSQGESYLGLGSSTTVARAGGGGGQTWNSAGVYAAGGSHATRGGTSTRLAEPGLCYGNPVLTKLFFGSAGGSAGGSVNGSRAGNGGGIILISAGNGGANLSSTGGITAKGANGVTEGGSGAGGSIKITTTGTLAAGASLINATGGSSTIAGGVGRVLLTGTSITGRSNPENYTPSGDVNFANTAVVNAYAFMTTASFGAGTDNTKAFSVDDADSFSSGDTVLIIQMQDYLNSTAGNYEKATISSISGTTVTLNSALTNTYYSGTANSSNALVAQMVRVPQYTSVTLSGGTIRSSAWNGNKGGIVAFDVTGTGALTMSGTGGVVVDGAGFRPTMGAGYQGESYLGLGSVSTAARAGGGGGTTTTNAYGAGGGYGSAGASGTGIGGGTYGDSSLTQLFLGSAGGTSGGSTQSNNAGYGGGIILISVGSGGVTVGGAGITSSGNGWGTYSGSGSGGSIKITTTGPLSAGTGLVKAAGGTTGIDGGSGRISLTGGTAPTGTTTPACTVSGNTCSGP